jgi:hypothetical protein
MPVTHPIVWMLFKFTERNHAGAHARRCTGADTHVRRHTHKHRHRHTRMRGKVKFPEAMVRHPQDVVHVSLPGDGVGGG